MHQPRTLLGLFFASWIVPCTLLNCASWVADDLDIPRPSSDSLVYVNVEKPAEPPLANRGQRASVLFFVLWDCPIANFYVPEMNRIAEEFDGRGVDFWLIYADPEFELEAAKNHVADYKIAVPAMIDRKFDLVRATGATMTPEAAVMSPEGELLYRGRIDDMYSELGHRRFSPTKRDLRDALDAITSGKPYSRSLTETVGCNIPEMQSSNDSPTDQKE